MKALVILFTLFRITTVYGLQGVPLGMESGTIPDSSLSASTVYDQNHGPERARLNTVRVGKLRGAWSALTLDINQWIQVDLLTIHSISGLVTQGRSDYSQWVTSFKINCSTDGTTFHTVQDPNTDPISDKVFQGNSDRNTVVNNTLPVAHLCRYVRLLPMTWGNHISLRMELYGQRTVAGVDKVFFVDKTNNSIFYADIQPGQLLTQQTYRKVPLKNIQSPGIMTYDRFNNSVIWTQTAARRIRIDSAGGKSSPVDIFRKTEPLSITFNEVNRRIYWFGNISHRLKVMQVNGSDKITLSQQKDHIYGVSVDGSRGYLYFSAGDNIGRINVDGSGEIVLLATGLTNVTSFTRNPQDKCLYWVNAPGIIERYDTLANTRCTLHDISAMIGRIEQIVVYNGVFYWVDSIRGGIGYINLQDPTINGFTPNITNLARDNYNISGITDLKVFVDEEFYEESICSDPSGLLYRGTVAETIGGLTCQKWTEQTPHKHTRTPANYPNSGLGDHNYCRNPDRDNTTWCYTTTYSKRFDYCAGGYLSPAFPICKICSSAPVITTPAGTMTTTPAGTMTNNPASIMPITTGTETGVPANLVPNPCLDYPCDRLHGICVNEGGKPSCSCIIGYELTDEGVMCQPNQNCTHCGLGECVPHNGTFECICGEGFTLGGAEQVQCDDINECESSPCDPERGGCVNTVGAFYCTCPNGYLIGQDHVTCLDDDTYDDLDDDIEDDDDDDEDEDADDKSDPHCDSVVDGIDDSKVPKSVIAIIVIIIIIIIIVIIVVVVCYRRKKTGKTGKA